MKQTIRSSSLVALVVLAACSTPPAEVATAGREARAPRAAAADALPEPAELRAAVERTLPLLQRSMDTWLDEIECMSCHHQGLGTLTVTMARERGVPVDEALQDRQLERMRGAFSALGLHGDAGINGTFGRGFQLLALGASGVPRDASTDGLAHYLKGNAVASTEPEGASFWASVSFRPPLEASEVTGTALALRALDLYRPDARAAETDATIARAVRWLRARRAEDAEDRALKLLGLFWGGAAEEDVRAAAADVLAQQRADGGWAQLATSESDAYATGQALAVLQQAGGLSTDDPAFARGVRWLLDAQLEDGSWLVETRRRSSGLPYFETGFPHGTHQFISTAATAWATMALCCALDPAPSAAFHAPRPPRSVEEPDDGLAPVHRAAAYGTLDELRAVLDAGGDPDAEGPLGLRPLHLAVRDQALVELLLERGATLDARTVIGATPLFLAGWYGEDDAVAQLLLDRGAAPLADPEAGRISPFLPAVYGGKRALVRRLLDAGASPDEAAPDGMTPLHVAVSMDDAAMAAVLLDAGAAVDPLCDHESPLLWASYDGKDALVRLLLARGANPDLTDEEGRTALTHAARVEHGNARTIDALLEGGADPSAGSFGERTPLEWARYFDNELAVAALEAAARRGP